MPDPRTDRSVVAGRHPVLELLRAGRSAERILIASDTKRSEILDEVRRLADAAAVPVRMVPRAQIDAVAGGLNHQGVAALAGRYRYSSLDRILSEPQPTVLFLDGITDPQNLGSLLRTAQAAGFSGVVVPARRAAGVTDAVRRVAAGAAEIVPVARVSNLGAALDRAKKSGLWVVGLAEQGSGDIWSSRMLDPPLGLVLGSEEKGMSRVVAQRCDEVVRIPTRGAIRSLNVTIAGAIAMFETVRRRELFG